MKVFIVPSFPYKGNDSSYRFAQNLVDVLYQHGNVCAISAPKEAKFHHASLYPCLLPKSPIFSNLQGKIRSYEDWLYRCGYTNPDYLENDVEQLCEAFKEFLPDLILDYGRPSAIIAARKSDIPVISYITGAIYRERPVHKKAITSLNETLSRLKLEQVLRYTDLLNYSNRRIVFGSSLLQPLPEEIDVDRFGTYLAPMEKKDLAIHVGAFFPELNRSATTIRSVMEEAFVGAPYEVTLSFPNARIASNQNINTQSSFRSDLIVDCSVVIHDGSDYIYQQALQHGIPQIVVSDGSWQRSWIASSVKRNGLGVQVLEEEFSVSSIYEAYRRVVSDDYYTVQAETFAKDVKRLQSIEQLLIL